MLKKLLIIPAMLWLQQTQAQNIQHISTLPLYPGPQDDVSLLIDLSFNSGDCALFLETHTIENDSIQIHVYHCPGPLAFICSVRDTIELGVFPQGTFYTKIFVHENNYFSPDPCAGGHISDSSDYQLVVFPISGVDDLANVKSHLSYDRDSKTIFLKNNSEKGKSLQLYDLLGKLILQKDFNSSNSISVPGLSEGVYVYKLVSGKEISSAGKILIQ